MEKPYKGRAIIKDNITDIQLIIPAKRNGFIILFLLVWLTIWSMGELFGLVMVIRSFQQHAGSMFTLCWLIGWTVFGVFALRTLTWNLKGMEVITIGQGTLTLARKGAIFLRPRVYDLSEIRKLRVQEDNAGFAGVFVNRNNDLSGMNMGGTIRFDYGLQTIKFGIGVDEAEARFLVERLKASGQLKEENFL